MHHLASFGEDPGQKGRQGVVMGKQCWLLARQGGHLHEREKGIWRMTARNPKELEVLSWEAAKGEVSRLRSSCSEATRSNHQADPEGCQS